MSTSMDAKRRGEAAITVAAPPEAIYDAVAEVTSIPQWSPECRRCAWVDGADGPAVGARFKGWNRRGLVRWATVCEVTAAERGQVFAWDVLYPLGRRHTRWRYEFTPVDGGTEVRESFELLTAPPELKLFRVLAFGGTAQRVQQLEDGVRQTLTRLKAGLEARA